MQKSKLFSYFIAFLALISSVYAAGANTPAYADPVTYLKYTAVLVIILSAILLIQKNWGEHHKKILFGLIAVPVMLSTLYMGGHTVYENMISVTKGPVHWHFDFQIWNCGERVDLLDPKFPKNKIGTPLYHEHNDERAHVEGVVRNIDDVTLGRFFEVIDGKLTSTELTVPTNDGMLSMIDGANCPDGSQARLKVFVNGDLIEDPENYFYYPHTLVPPGDCIIFEYSPLFTQETSYLCESWDVQEWSYENYEELRQSKKEYAVKTYER